MRSLRSGRISIGNLEARLKQIDDLIDSELREAAAAGQQLDWSELKKAAVDATKQALGEMNALRNAYGAKLNAAQLEMAADGYDTDAIDGGAPKTPAPQPNGRPDSQPGNLDDALNHIAGAPVPAAVPPKPVPMDPKNVESFKAMARDMLQRSGVPPDRIESRLNEIVARAQRGLGPSYRAPEPPRQPPPGFGEGFADRWFSTEQAIKNLLGQGGPGEPGVVDSWTGLLKGTAETAANPAGAAVEEIKNALSSPSPAYYLGEKTFDVGSTAATLPFGGEGAAVRAGLPVRTIAEGGAPEALVRGCTRQAVCRGKSSGRSSVPPGVESGPRTTDFPRATNRNPPSCPRGPSSTGSAAKGANTSHRMARCSRIAH